MSIEDDVYEQLELGLVGEFPVIPVWEKTVDELIVEEEEQPKQYRRPQFQEDLIDGFI